MTITEAVRRIRKIAKDGRTSRDFQAIRLLAEQILKSLGKQEVETSGE